MNVVQDYFNSQANVLDASYKASLVKGHHGDTGSNREKIIQNWFRQHIPRTTIPELGGKIIDSSGYCTNQIDLIIYNNTYPQFGANEKTYYFTEGAVYAIQVKSVLTSAELTDAVTNLASVERCRRKFGGGIFIGTTRLTIPTGIFAYDTDYKDSQSILDALKRLEKEKLPTVDFVCVNQKVFICYIRSKEKGIDKAGKVIENLPEGYVIADNTSTSIWNMLIDITNEGRKIIYAGVDFHKYMVNIAKTED